MAFLEGGRRRDDIKAVRIILLYFVVSEIVMDTTSIAEESQEQPRSADRRGLEERRKLSRIESGYTGEERRQSVLDRRTGLERRRGAGIRREEARKAAEEGEMTTEQFEFIMAIETYKKVNKKMYPTWTEVLEVVRQLGYRKVSGREVNLGDVPEPAIQNAA